MQFYNRISELENLKRTTILAQKSAQMTTITGRRRIGKTELLARFLSDIDNGLYFFVSRKKPVNLSWEFNDTLRQINPLITGVPSSFDQFLQNLFETAKTKPIVAVFDEFQNFRYTDPSIFSVFQKFWDEHKNAAKIHVVFVGSILSMMEKIFSDQREPLFGRNTAKIEVAPFSPCTVAEIIKHWGVLSPNVFLNFYTLFGGVPKYYALVDSYGLGQSKIETVLSSLIVNKSGILYKEVYDMLIEEFGKEHQTYFAIMHAIASSKNSISEIANACALTTNIASKYLSELLNYYRLIERWTPFSIKKKVDRQGLYFISDEFTKFWFRYIYRYEGLIEIKLEKEALSKIMADFNNLRGLSFERLVREMLIEINSHGKFPFQFEKIGRYWDRKRSVEIDLILQNETSFMFGECKLAAKSIDDKVVDNFKKKIELVEKNPKIKNIQLSFFTLDKPDSNLDLKLKASNILSFNMEEMLSEISG